MPDAMTDRRGARPSAHSFRGSHGPSELRKIYRADLRRQPYGLLYGHAQSAPARDANPSASTQSKGNVRISGKGNLREPWPGHGRGVRGESAGGSKRGA